jgi:hypothetical protein
VPSQSDLAPSVGGILHLEYRLPGALAAHPIRLAVEPFNTTPSGSLGDYLYTSPHGESGLLATFAALGALWAPYYPAVWSLYVVAVWPNVSGFPHGPLQPPQATPVPGAHADAVSADAVCKRMIALYSEGGERWRLHLRRTPADTVGEHLNAGVGVPGGDARDEAIYAYVSGNASALVGRDGTQFQPGGRVRTWWDAPLPVGVSGAYVVSG